ncbi:MAG: sulfate adenylyltransferase subunit CysN [Steroidobacteraceae bacterium]
MGDAPASNLLRFITCGSVDDGKSTLIGRLLYDSKLLLEDQLSALVEASRTAGTRGQQLDFALLLDGLAAEREQNITIDVAYRYFATPRRRFIVADTPGHEQYTRNMVTGASTADLAVILIDARKGLLVQTRRHSHLISLLGIRHAVLAVNKMDLVEFSQQRFQAIEREYRELAVHLPHQAVTAIPMVAVDGDNVSARSARMPWYSGPALLELLETVRIEAPAAAPFRMPVQWVNRPHLDFRGYAGRIAAGAVHPGDRVRALPSGRECRVTAIVTADGSLPRAVAGQSVTLTLSDEIDLSRGDVLADADAPASVGSQFEATLVALHANAVLPGRSYKMKIGTTTVGAIVAPLKYRIDINTWQHSAAERLELNEVGVCELELDRPIAFEPYEHSRDLGGFILIDRITNDTVAAGTLTFALRRSQNVHWQTHDIDKHARAALNNQRPTVVWMTGFSGAGKSTIANLVEKRLHAMGRRTYLLDGDNIRHGLNKDLGFTEQDRVENIRRVAEVARLMVDAGLIVLVAFISPFRAERRAARALFAEDEFIEVFVDAPLAEVERRDVKGLYKRARAGQLKNFTGIDSPYEPPQSPELHLDMARLSPEVAAGELADYVLHRQR